LQERWRGPEADGVAGERAAGSVQGCGREGTGRRRRPAAEGIAFLRERGRRQSFGCVSWSGPMDSGLSKFDVHTCPWLLDRISSLSPHPTESSPSGPNLFQIQSPWIYQVQFQIYLRLPHVKTHTTPPSFEVTALGKTGLSQLKWFHVTKMDHISKEKVRLPEISCRRGNAFIHVLTCTGTVTVHNHG
jgi:hypothetical protein